MRYVEDGVQILENIWSPEQLDTFEGVIVSRARQMLDATEQGLSDTCDTPYQVLQTLEKRNPQLFYELCSRIGGCVSGMMLASAPGIRDFVAEVMGSAVDGMFFGIPSLFWNDRKVTRLHYAWHQEASYLQAYSKAIHLWAPLFRDLEDEDGPMLVLPGSHKAGLLPFRSYREERGVTQLSIDEDLLKPYTPFYCSLKRGSAVMFHQAMVHCTGPNLAGNPRISLIVRYFDTSDEAALKAPLVFKNPLEMETIMATANG